ACFANHSKKLGGALGGSGLTNAVPLQLVVSVRGSGQGRKMLQGWTPVSVTMREVPPSAGGIPSVCHMRSGWFAATLHLSRTSVPADTQMSQVACTGRSAM